MNFNGFPRELPDFLFELTLFNTVDNEKENAEKYKKLASAPLSLLYDDILPTVLSLELGLETRRARCLSAPYKDKRYSPAAPIKEYLYLRFRRESLADDIPGLCFGMGHDGYFCGLTFYNRTSRGAARLRDRAAASLDRFAAELSRAESAGLVLSGEPYKRDHYPSLPDSEVKRLLNMKSFDVGAEFPIDETLFSDALVSRLADSFRASAGLLSLCAE